MQRPLVFTCYGDCYKYIRQANIFLEKAHVITTSGTQGDRLEEDELNEMRANVRFMRALQLSAIGTIRSYYPRKR